MKETGPECPESVTTVTDTLTFDPVDALELAGGPGWPDERGGTVTVQVVALGQLVGADTAPK